MLPDELPTFGPEKSPFFSVITPSRNALEKLRLTATSLKDGHAEWIIVDGASTDGTACWLNENAIPRCIWISEPDTGVYDAMNKGIRLATGRYLLFLGAGDTLRADAIAIALKILSKSTSKSPIFLYGDVVLAGSINPVTEGRFSNYRICRSNICHQGIFYDRRIFEMLGCYELKYPLMADWAFNLKCFGDDRIENIHLSEVVAEFEGGGISDTQQDLPFAQDRLQLIRDRIGPAYALFFRLDQAYRRRIRYFYQKFRVLNCSL